MESDGHLEKQTRGTEVVAFHRIEKGLEEEGKKINFAIRRLTRE